MPLIYLVSGLSSGILLGYFLSDEIESILSMGFIVFLVTAVLQKQASFQFNVMKSTWYFQTACFSFFFCIGLFLLHKEKTILSSAQLLDKKTIKGIVYKKTISSKGYQTLHLELENFYTHAQKYVAQGNILITLDTLDQYFSIGDELIVSAPFKAFENDPNPGSFDAVFYYTTHHYVARAFASSHAIVKIGTKSNITVFFAKWQESIKKHIQGLLPENISGIATAFLIGVKEDIDKQVIESFQNTGAMHVLAVSGLHVGIILLLIQKILERFSRWISKKKAIIISLIFCWIFGLISGASPAVIRAVIMFSVLAVGQLIDRKGNSVNGLIVSAIILLLYDPYFLFDVGFQLSYAAMFGILIFYRPIFSLFEHKTILASWLWQGSAVGIAATITTFPLVLYWFHQFPNYFLISNIVIMVLGGVVLYAILGLVATAWIPLIKEIIIFCCIWSIQGMIWGIHWVNELPGGVSSGFELSNILYLVLSASILSFSFSILYKKQWNYIAISMLICCFVWLTINRLQRFNTNKMEVYCTNDFCGSIQFNGKLYTFQDKAQKPNQIIQQVAKNSGLKIEKHFNLSQKNSIQIALNKILFKRTSTGWNIVLNGKKIKYRTNGLPSIEEPQSLLSKRLQLEMGFNRTVYFQHIF